MEWYVILVIVATVLGLIVLIMQRGVLIAQRIRISEYESEIKRLQMELSELADLKVEPKEPMFEIKQTVVPLIPLKYKKALSGPLAKILDDVSSDEKKNILQSELYDPFYKELNRYITCLCLEDHEDFKVYEINLTIADVHDR